METTFTNKINLPLRAVFQLVTKSKFFGSARWGGESINRFVRVLHAFVRQRLSVYQGAQPSNPCNVSLYPQFIYLIS